MYCHIKIGTNWCLFIRTVMRDSVISKSAPIGADLDLTISLRSTVRMNKEAPIGADSFCDNERYCQIKIGTNWCLFSLSNERYCQIKIGTNWCLFIWTVMRDSVISKSAPIGADLDLTISLFIPSWYDNALKTLKTVTFWWPDRATKIQGDDVRITSYRVKCYRHSFPMLKTNTQHLFLALYGPA